jgi:hypothetical protein
MPRNQTLPGTAEDGSVQRLCNFEAELVEQHIVVCMRNRMQKHHALHGGQGVYVFDVLQCNNLLG